jgi:putative hydrolase of HD superfamily
MTTSTSTSWRHADYTTAARADAMIDLGRLALGFGRIDRITFQEDGTTPESDTDHTVMLGLTASALASSWYRDRLDIGRVAQYALVHDLVEVYAGDTPTLRITDDQRAAKHQREQAAYLRIAEEFALRLPWLATTIAEYELLRTPEARFVKALDKILPKVTHVLNGGRTLLNEGMTAASLDARLADQRAELGTYAGDFPELLALHDEMRARVVALLAISAATR